MATSFNIKNRAVKFHYIVRPIVNEIPTHNNLMYHSRLDMQKLYKLVYKISFRIKGDLYRNGQQKKHRNKQQ